MTPYREVEWSRQAGFYCVFLLFECDGEYCDSTLHHGCRFRFCSRSRYYANVSLLCRGRHSAYSPTCYCWTPPQHLMVVSRTMYRDAKAIFYSQNRVAVRPARDVHLWDTRESTLRLTASTFITRHMWPDVLHHLRTLELLFPPPEANHIYGADEPIFRDWLFAVNHLAAHANLRNLTLVVHIALIPQSTYTDLGRLLRHMSAMAEPSSGQFSGGYAQLLSPLSSLSRLKRFFVYLDASWHYPPRDAEYMDISAFKGVNLQARRRANAIETQLEKLVMGDTYDSFEVGKGDEKLSSWLESVRGLVV